MSAKPWSKKQLDHMLFHNFLGTLADNSIEIGWVISLRTSILTS